jgi:hypothetical protein
MSREHSTYWQLVEQLMHFGWYHEGQDLKRDRSGRSWRFREGHTIEGRTARALTILAPSEFEAMRLLADQLRQDEAATRRRQSAQASPASDAERPG